MRHYPFFLLVFLLGCSAPPQSPTEVWSGPDGRVSVQTKVPPYTGGTALDLWTPPTPLSQDSNAEITLHRCTEWETSPPCMERINLSAMAGPQYRLGIERGGTGDFHPLYFCFESVAPGVAYCPMRMTLESGMEFNIAAPTQAEQWISASSLASKP